MVAILKKGSGTNCTVMETVRYSSYGVPFGIPPGDIEASACRCVRVRRRAQA